MSTTFPGESAEYRAARNRLLEQEIELRRSMEAVAAAGRSCPGGLRLPGTTRRRPPDGREAVGAVHAGQGFTRDLQLHVSARPRRRPPGAASGPNGTTPALGGTLPLMCCAAGPTRRRGGARTPAHQPRGRGQGAAGARPGIRRRARLATAAPPVLELEQLQPRLPGRDCGGTPTADAERVPPRRRDDPPLLGLRALLRADGRRSGPPSRRHPGAGLEPVRHDTGGPRERLGRAAALLLTA